MKIQCGILLFLCVLQLSCSFHSTSNSNNLVGRNIIYHYHHHKHRINGLHFSMIPKRGIFPHGKAATSTTTNLMENSNTQSLVGEDSAVFKWKEQKPEDWFKFTLATSTVLASVSYIWFLPPGPHLGDKFLDSVQSWIGTTSPDATIFCMLTIFAISHSGLAGLRPYAEDVVGPRAWRVVFAVVSLPLALSCISYFVNHSHEGTRLWDLTGVPGVHTACWITNFISFLFLYPSTFNLLEIAAIEKPKLHLWETGIIRITRHPQSIGQIAWCISHCAWLGTSTVLSASAVLILHHLYSIWHGDRRLERQYPEQFPVVKDRTSVIPFQAILDGRQKLPDNYYSEFLRGPYLIVVCGTMAAYLSHPWMMAGASLLNW